MTGHGIRASTQYLGSFEMNDILQNASLVVALSRHRTLLVLVVYFCGPDIVCDLCRIILPICSFVLPFSELNLKGAREV